MKNIKKNISIEKLHAFENHPYKVQDNEEMTLLTESIQKSGILTPLIVRPLENTTDEYEIISGHRRAFAARKAGIDMVPALIFALDRDAAAVTLVDSNLHREHILPSEKAFAYKMKMEAMSRQGERTDLTSDQVGRKLETAELIAEQADESKTQVRRYIRLTHLIPPLLDMVDEGKIAFTPAVELSYLTEQEQRNLLEEIHRNDCTPSLSQACRLKKLSQSEDVSSMTMAEIMREQKANQREMFKMPMERIRKFASNTSEQSLEDFILKACEHYRRYLLRQRERER